MTFQHEALHNLLESALESVGYELVCFEWLKQGKYSLLRVYIDGPNGVTLDNITEASRQISALLDVEDLISNHYKLEVSSPGLNRPLFKQAHYSKFVGRGVRLRLRHPVENQRNITGKLISVDGNNIVVTADDEKQWQLTINDIEKANLIAEL